MSLKTDRISAEASARNTTAPFPTGTVILISLLSILLRITPCPAEETIQNQWLPMIKPDLSILRAVWRSPGSDDIFAAGDRGVIVRKKTNGWETMPHPGEADITGIWGSAADDVFAVGDRGTVLHFDGGSWRKMDAGTDLDLKAVWGFSPENIYAVGAQRLILRYNGKGWRQVNWGSTQTLYDIWGDTEENIFAVGGAGLILHFDGSRWIEMESGIGHILRTVRGVSGTDVYAASSGTLLHYDGRGWSAVKNRYSVTDIWGPGGSILYAAAQEPITGKAVILIRETDGWRPLDVMPEFPVYAVTAASDGTRIGVGGDVFTGGVILRLDADAEEPLWRQPAPGSVGGLNDIFPDELYDRYTAVGEGGTILNYDGDKWSRLNSGVEADLTGIWGSDFCYTYCYVVGKNGTVIRSYDGGDPNYGLRWDKVEVPTSENLNAICGVATYYGGIQSLTAVGEHGTIIHFDGISETWTEMESGVGVSLNDVWCLRRDGPITAVGDGGVIVTWNGQAWTRMESGTQRNLQGIWGIPDHRRGGFLMYAVGDPVRAADGIGGTVLHYDGWEWRHVNTGAVSVESFEDVWGAGKNDIFIAGKNGVIRHFNGKTWDLLKTGTYDEFRAVVGEFLDSETVLAVDRAGGIFKYSPPKLSLPSEAGEGTAERLEATVRLPQPPADNIIFTIATDDASEVSVPDSVTVPAGSSSASFDFQILDDAEFDGTRPVGITVRAEGFGPETAVIRVHDNEAAAIAVTLPEAAYESGGLLEGAGEVRINVDADAPVDVALASEVPEILKVPSSVTIPRGARSAVFDLRIIDDDEIENNASAAVSASVEGWITGRGEMTVMDDDRMVLSVEIWPRADESDETPLIGTVAVSEPCETDVTIFLDASDASELSIPETVILPAGKTRVSFAAHPLSDAFPDGSQTVTVTASASGFVAADAEIEIRDEDGLWDEVRRGTSVLRSVWGFAPDDVYAVGWNGLILHNDGTGWRTMKSGTYESIRNLWGLDAGHLYASGGDALDLGFILFFDGNEWRRFYEGGKIVNGVWGTAPDHLFAVGKNLNNSGMILHYDGEAWREMETDIQVELRCVWGFGPEDVYVSGKDGYFFHYDGTAWEPMDSPTDADIEALWGSGPSDLFAVGAKAILHYDGTAWTLMDEGGEWRLKSVFGLGPDQVYASGNSGIAVRYDGETWTEMEGTPDESFWGVWAHSDRQIYAAGGGGLILRHDGETWITDNEPFLDFRAVQVFPNENGIGATAFAVGEEGVIHHYDGETWTEEEKGFYPDLNTLWGRSRWDITAAGDDGVILHYDGSRWRRTESGVYDDINDLYGLPETDGPDLFAVGDDGLMLHYDGSEWNSLPRVTDRRLQGVWAAPSEDGGGYVLMAVGDDGLVLTRKDGQWEQTAAGEKDLYDIWGTSSSNVYAAGNGGNLWRFDGNVWMREDLDVGLTLKSLWGTRSDDIYAVGNAGVIFHYDGWNWVPLGSTNISLNGISGTENDFFIVGNNRCILHRRPVSVSVPRTVSENAGILLLAGRVGIGAPLQADLTVSLVSHLPDSLKVPETVVIPAGEMSAEFDLILHDNDVADGVRRAAVTASAEGFHLGTGFTGVADDESGTLNLELPDMVEEGQGMLAGKGMVFLETPAVRDLPVLMYSDDPVRIRVPRLVIIPEGETDARFDLEIPDNQTFDTVSEIAVRAVIPDWPDAWGTVMIEDNENLELFIRLDEESRETVEGSEGTGSVSIPGDWREDLVIEMTADSDELRLPESVLIPAGTRSASFRFEVRDNDVRETSDAETRTAEIVATAPGWLSGSDTVRILDNEPGIIRLESSRFLFRETDETAVVKLLREESRSGEITVDVTVEPGSAMTDADFLMTSETLVFENGETEKEILIRPVPDAEIEGAESFRIEIAAEEQGQIGTPSAAEVVIVDEIQTETDELTESHLKDVWGVAHDRIFAVGWRGAILEYDGESWGGMKLDAGGSVHLESVWGNSESNLFAVGHDGVILHYDGDDWRFMESGTHRALYDVRGTSHGEVYAVGAGVMLRYEGETWEPIQGLPMESPDLRGIWGDSVADMIAVGAEGVILSSDGLSWRVMDSGTDLALYDVWGDGEGVYYAVGEGGVILRHEAGIWKEMEKAVPDPVLFLDGIWGISRSEAFAVGFSGTLLHLKDGVWGKMDLETDADRTFHAIWGPAGGTAPEFHAVGDNGMYLRHGPQ